MLTRSVRTFGLLALLAALAFTTSCIRVSTRPLSINELQAIGQRGAASEGPRNNERIALGVTQQEDRLHVNPTYYYQGSLQYAGQDYVQCRELDAGATRTIRGMGIAGIIGGLGLVGASFNYETDSYFEDPNLPYLVPGLLSTAIGTLAVVIPNAMLRNNKGRTCKTLEGEQYTHTELRNFSPREYPWTLQIQSTTGDVLFESTYDEIDQQTLSIRDLNACALPDQILMMHPKSTLRNVEVVASVQRDGKTVQERVLHPLPFIERSALHDVLRDEYFAAVRRSVTESFVRLSENGSKAGFSVTIEKAPTLQALKQAAAVQAPLVDPCGAEVELDGQAFQNLAWARQLEDNPTCLQGSCAASDGTLSVPVRSTFVLTTNTTPPWSWRVTIGADGSLTSTPLELTQVSTGGGFESTGLREARIQMPTMSVPELSPRFTDGDLDNGTARNLGDARWATSDTPFYRPASCELTHPTCEQQSGNMYGFCREMICANIYPDTGKGSGYADWAREIRHIGGNLAVTPDSELLRTGRLTYSRLEVVAGMLHVPFLLTHSEHRAPHFSFPRLEYAGSLVLTPESNIGGDGSKRTTLSLPRLREVSSLTLSGVRAGMYLRVDAPNLQRIQKNLRIEETQLTSDGLRRLTPKLTEVAGHVMLYVVLELDSLRGLENLRVIHGDLVLAAIPNLTSLDGLKNLECVKGSIVVNGNESLRSVRGLRNLKSVGSPSCGEEPDDTMDVAIQIANNANLRSLDGLESIGNIGGVVEINGNPKLTDIQALSRTNAPGFLLRWGTGITRFSRAFEAVTQGESVCWIDERTAEKVGETPCFVVE